MDRVIILVMVCLLGITGMQAQQLQITNPVRFLALGDSYTIGQSVEVGDRWPVQLGDTLTTLGFTITETKIIATTGWTTGNLLNALNNNPLDNNYSLVSLLIGVNNQYQGGSIDTYATQFEELLNRAIGYAGGDATHVVVVSIPDYHFTPFGQGSPQISEEIDAFNAVNLQITQAHNVPYVNITDISRRGLAEPELVAGDGLHPSGIQYGLWVRRIVEQADLQVVSATDDAAVNQEIAIYPNPVRDLLYMDAGETSTCEILDLNGTAVLNTTTNGDEGIQVSDLTPGMYLLSVRSASGTRYQRFVKL